MQYRLKLVEVDPVYTKPSHSHYTWSNHKCFSKKNIFQHKYFGTTHVLFFYWFIILFIIVWCTLNSIKKITYVPYQNIIEKIVLTYDCPMENQFTWRYFMDTRTFMDALILVESNMCHSYIPIQGYSKRSPLLPSLPTYCQWHVFFFELQRETN